MGIYPITKCSILTVYISLINLQLTFISTSLVVNLGSSNMNCIDNNIATGNSNITAKINMALLETNLSCRKFANDHGS